MNGHYVLKTALICVFSFFLVYAGFIITSRLQHNHFSFVSDPINIKKVASTILRKNSTFQKEYLRIELEVRDNPSLPNQEIVEVTFEGKTISLNPSDPSGERGVTYIQIMPGKYIIKWKIKKASYAWPQIETHSKILVIKEDDRWTHILIFGQDIEITY